jgi:hypothetical protein
MYLVNKYSTMAALWWPTAGADIDIRRLPATSGKAVQLKLKTTTFDEVRYPRREN